MHDPMVVAFEIRRPWPKRSRLGEGRRCPSRRHLEKVLGYERDDSYSLVKSAQGSGRV